MGGRVVCEEYTVYRRRPEDLMLFSITWQCLQLYFTAVRPSMGATLLHKIIPKINAQDIPFENMGGADWGDLAHSCILSKDIEYLQVLTPREEARR